MLGEVDSGLVQYDCARATKNVLVADLGGFDFPHYQR